MSGPLHENGDGRAHGKSAAAFRTISEVALDLDVAQHVLRFWESKFPQVRPLKRGGGRRYYRPEDVDLLRQIRTLLYEEGYTIRGVQKLLKTRRVQGDQEPLGDAPELPADTSGDEAPEEIVGAEALVGVEEDRGARLRSLRDELIALRNQLRLADSEL